MSGQPNSFLSVSLHAGADAQVRCSVYEDVAPILSLETVPLAVSVTTAGRAACSPEEVAFARRLAEQAAKFAAECERLHTAQQPQSPAGADAPGEDETSAGAARSAA